MGRLLGSLKDFSAAELGGVAIEAALERAGVTGDQVDYVILGQVLQAGAGQIPARQAAVAAGIPMTCRRCWSTRCACPARRDRAGRPAHRAGEFEVVVAGGMESMTNAAPAARPAQGFKYGSVQLLDAMAYDGLTDAFDQRRDGRVDRAGTTPGWASPAPSRTSSPPGRTSGPPTPRRTACSTTRSPGSRSRSGGATRSSSATTRGSGRTPPSSRWPSCTRRSPRTARSPPAPPPRSPTAPARSW